MKFDIQISDQKSSARVGLLHTDHGEIHTPAFMPIGTHGAVKTMSPDELNSLGTEIILGNTYHLYLRPGSEIVKKAGGLHRFMNWPGPILTDSGGYQVFSLARLNTLSDEGVEFQSHLDGSRHFFTPEVSMDIQRHLGSDIIMAFDECPPGDADNRTIEKAVKRTTAWISRCRDHLRDNPSIFKWEQTLFPIVQGGIVPELRRRSTEEVSIYGQCGIAIGGLAVGEAKDAMFETIDLLDELLTKDQPRYLMGVGKPPDLIRAVRLGMDMFDCVLPTRNARNGQLFTSQGTMNIRNQQYQEDFSAVDENCSCDLCRNYTRAYLRHLLNVNEILGLRLTTLHNLTYYMNLMQTIREQIKSGTFDSWATTELNRVGKK